MIISLNGFLSPWLLSPWQLGGEPRIASCLTGETSRFENGNPGIEAQILAKIQITPKRIQAYLHNRLRVSILYKQINEYMSKYLYVYTCICVVLTKTYMKKLAKAKFKQIHIEFVCTCVYMNVYMYTRVCVCTCLSTNMHAYMCIER